MRGKTGLIAPLRFLTIHDTVVAIIQTKNGKVKSNIYQKFKLEDASKAHKILQSSSQISPISGSIKEQVVTFIGKEKLDLYGKSYDVEHFKLTSKDMSIPKNKRLNFDIWFDKKHALIMKVTYSRMGNWEYRVKNFE